MFLYLYWRDSAQQFVRYEFDVLSLLNILIKRFGHRPSSVIKQIILCPLHVVVVVIDERMTSQADHGTIMPVLNSYELTNHVVTGGYVSSEASW